eukprot:5730149-Pleurochrysis_carterae.AAC.1
MTACAIIRVFLGLAVLLVQIREFSAIAFWWKPESSHMHFYPVVRDDDGKPKRCIVNGNVQYEVCPNGIEVFEC